MPSFIPTSEKKKPQDVGGKEKFVLDLETKAGTERWRHQAGENEEENPRRRHQKGQDTSKGKRTKQKLKLKQGHEKKASSSLANIECEREGNSNSR